MCQSQVRGRLGFVGADVRLAERASQVKCSEPIGVKNALHLDGTVRVGFAQLHHPKQFTLQGGAPAAELR
jgi:hypothetical protein